MEVVMARKPRFNLPGVPQHVVQRGNIRDPCFFAETDYHRYKHDLHEAAKRNNVDKIEQMIVRQTKPGKPGRPRIEEGQSIYYVL